MSYCLGSGRQAAIQQVRPIRRSGRAAGQREWRSGQGGTFTHNHPGRAPFWSFRLDYLKWADALYLDEVPFVGISHGSVTVSVICFPYEALAMPDVAYDHQLHKQQTLQVR